MFHDIVQVAALPQSTPLRQRSLGFQFPDRRWVRRVLIHVDHSGRGIARRVERLVKETFRRSSIALGREQKVNRLTGGVHCSVQVLLLTAHLYIRFVHTVGLVRPPEVWPTALL